MLIVLAIGSCVMFIVTISLWWLIGVLGGLIVAAILAATVKFREIEAPELPEKLAMNKFNSYFIKSSKFFIVR